MKIIQDEKKPIAPEIIAGAIIDIAKGMNAVNATRLTRRAIVALIHAESKIPKGHIEIVLNNLDRLELLWLKPAKVTK